MDIFETELRAATIDLVANMKIDRHLLAISRLQRLAATLYHLLVERGERYQILLTAGNSGLYVREFCQIIYRQLNIELPVLLSLPIHRFNQHGGLYDNISLLQETKRQVGSLTRFNRVLFVDDEIKRGTTAQACFDLLLRAVAWEHQDHACSFTIVAENHFFEWHVNDPRFAVRYFAPARLLYGLENNLAFCLPDSLRKTACAALQQELSQHHLITLILGGALKRIQNGVPIYDSSLAKPLLEAGSDYQAARLAFITGIEAWIATSFERYANGDITFKF